MNHMRLEKREFIRDEGLWYERMLLPQTYRSYITDHMPWLKLTHVSIAHLILCSPWLLLFWPKESLLTLIGFLIFLWTPVFFIFLMLKYDCVIAKLVSCYVADWLDRFTQIFVLIIYLSFYIVIIVLGWNKFLTNF